MEGDRPAYLIAFNSLCVTLSLFHHRRVQPLYPWRHIGQSGSSLAS